MIDGDLSEAFDVQQTRTQKYQLSLFSRQLAYMQATDCAARAIFRNEDTGTGRRLHKQFSLPEKSDSHEPIE